MASTTSRSLHSQPASKRSRISIVVGPIYVEAGGARSPPNAHIGRQGPIGGSGSLRRVGAIPTTPFRKVSGMAKDSMKGLRALGQDMHSAMQATKNGNGKKPQKTYKVRAGPKYTHLPMVCNGGAAITPALLDFRSSGDITKELPASRNGGTEFDSSDEEWDKCSEDSDWDRV
ncbi:hypothetical protein BU16DRAFT_612445 [Lophium mytilinum]|uniref:Uncharacterized protein n=1 Tax=Lophium mytilinum TaxID=390894 RepID=A0A6A6RHB4_9PEZI|nr:hypothetical protein BU16DRAFT_612445 [Lophium mytilinum]